MNSEDNFNYMHFLCMWMAEITSWKTMCWRTWWQKHTYIYDLCSNQSLKPSVLPCMLHNIL